MEVQGGRGKCRLQNMASGCASATHAKGNQFSHYSKSARAATVVGSDTPDNRESLNSSEAAKCLLRPAKQPDTAQEKLHPGSAPRHLGTSSTSGREKRLRELGSICQHTESSDQRGSV